MFNGRIALSPQEIFDKDFKIDTRVQITRSR